MAALLICPDVQVLKRFVLGLDSGDDRDATAEHVEKCSNCMAALKTISSTDTLVEAVRAQETVREGPEQAALKMLVAKIHALLPDAKSKVDLTLGAVPAAAAQDTVGLATETGGDVPDPDEDGFAPPEAPDEIGRLAGYRLLKLLGVGGMGKVFLAEDAQLRRKVALKVMKPELARNATARERFLQEARLAAAIEHDHIVPIYQVGQDGGIPFLAMPFLNGLSLEDLLSRQGALNIKQILRIGTQIADGLAAAHQQNLIHRDIKPGNVWIEPIGGGRVKILDFGLARSTVNDISLTQPGAIMGTPAYMPPEQARCEKVDSRCDLYSLGCVLYRMATGDLPIKGNDTIAMLMALALSEPTPPIELRRDLPPALSDLIMKLLAKDREQRPRDAHEVAASLRAIERAISSPAAGETQVLTESVVPPGTTETLPEPKTTTHKTAPRRFAPKGVLAGAAAVLLFALLGAGIVFFIPSAKGVIRVEVDDPSISFKIDGKGDYVIVDGDNKEVRFSPGEHSLKFKKGNMEFETDKFTLTRDDKVVVKVELLKGHLQITRNDQIVSTKVISEPAGQSRGFAVRFDFVKGDKETAISFPRLRLPVTGPLTMEGYVKCDKPDAGPNVHLFGPPYQISVSFTGARPALHWRAGQPPEVRPVLSSQNSLTVGKWHHLAGVRDGKEHRLYVDGILVNTVAAPEPLRETDNQTQMGYMCAGVSLREVRFSRTARYTSTRFHPEQRFSPDADTLALYHLDEGHGDFVKDTSGNGHDGKLIPSSKWVDVDGNSPTRGSWQPSPEQQAYLKAAAALPIKERMESVKRKMREVNPIVGESPAVELIFEPADGSPTFCRVSGTIAYDAWPLTALTSLTRIDLTGSHVLDFRLLSTLPLEEIDLKLILDNIASEEALKGLGTLKTVNGIATKDFWVERQAIRKEIDAMAGVSKGLPPEDQQTWIRRIMKRLHPKVEEGAFNAISVSKADNGLLHFRGYDLHGGVYDFSPVRALPIESFFLLDGNLFDATPLGKTKLKVLSLNRGNRVRDLSPLAGLPLESLNLAATYADIRPLKGMPLKHLTFDGTPEIDLSPLKGMPLEVLALGGAKDLAPLAGLPLKRLSSGHYSPISDLAPLKGMPLEALILHHAPVNDISPLAGMKLKELGLFGAPVADFSPLKGMPLTSLDIGRGTIDPVLATLPLKSLDLSLRLHSVVEEKALRALKLEKINGRRPEDFWNEIAQRRKADMEKIAATAKLPIEKKPLEELLHDCGRYPVVKIEDGAVVEGRFGGGGDYTRLAAFPKLRKLSLGGGDFSPLLMLPELEELTCPPLEVMFNRPVLTLLPKLKTINGKPAQAVLGK